MLHWYNSSVLWRLIRLVMKFCSSSVNCLYQWILIWSTPNWIVNWLGTKQPGKFFHYRVLPGFTRAFTELLPSFFFFIPSPPPPPLRPTAVQFLVPLGYRVVTEFLPSQWARWAEADRRLRRAGIDDSIRRRPTANHAPFTLDYGRLGVCLLLPVVACCCCCCCCCCRSCCRVQWASADLLVSLNCFQPPSKKRCQGWIVVVAVVVVVVVVVVVPFSESMGTLVGGLFPFVVFNWWRQPTWFFIRLSSAALPDAEEKWEGSRKKERLAIHGNVDYQLVSREWRLFKSIFLWSHYVCVCVCVSIHMEYRYGRLDDKKKEEERVADYEWACPMNAAEEAGRALMPH